jgi:hypothetical protein
MLSALDRTGDSYRSHFRVLHHYAASHAASCHYLSLVSTPDEHGTLAPFMACWKMPASILCITVLVLCLLSSHLACLLSSQLPFLLQVWGHLLGGGQPPRGSTLALSCARCGRPRRSDRGGSLSARSDGSRACQQAVLASDWHAKTRSGPTSCGPICSTTNPPAIQHHPPGWMS